MAYPVVSGGFRWFPVTNAVELHGRFKGSKRKKDPHPLRVRVSLKIILQLVGYGHIGDAFRVAKSPLADMVHGDKIPAFPHL